MELVRKTLKEREASFKKVPKAPEGFFGKLFENTSTIKKKD